MRLTAFVRHPGCIESVCDGDYGAAFSCLTGMLGTAVSAG